MSVSDRQGRLLHIDALVADLAPTPTLVGPGVAALCWQLAAGALVFAWFALTGGFRPGVLDQLASSPAFALESALAVGLAIAAAVGALRLSIPGLGRAPVWGLAMLALFGLWAGSFALGFVAPHVEPSMIGKRPRCYAELLALGALATLAVLPLARRRMALASRTALAGFAGSGVVWLALAMQLACMYDPWHAFSHHLLPVVTWVAAAFLVGPRLLPRP